MKKTLLSFLLMLLIPTAILAQAATATKEDVELLRKDIENLKTYIDLKIEALNTRIDSSIEAVNARIDANGARIDALNDKIDMVNDKVDYLFGFLGLLILIIAIPPIADKMAWWRKRRGARLMAAIRELSRDELAELKDMLNKV
ncbi:MAG: hypothetical protein ACUVXI_07490 [bacterium]